MGFWLKAFYYSSCSSSNFQSPTRLVVLPPAVIHHPVHLTERCYPGLQPPPPVSPLSKPPFIPAILCLPGNRGPVNASSKHLASYHRFFSLRLKGGPAEASISFPTYTIALRGLSGAQPPQFCKNPPCAPENRPLSALPNQPLPSLCSSEGPLRRHLSITLSSSLSRNSPTPGLMGSNSHLPYTGYLALPLLLNHKLPGIRNCITFIQLFRDFLLSSNYALGTHFFLLRMQQSGSTW